MISVNGERSLFPSDALTTQTRTVTAVPHTLSFYGNGTIVLSGAHVATVIGAGSFPSRTTLTFTPTAGSLILTVTGTVEFSQLEAGAFASSYIPTTTAALTRSADVCSITGGAFSGFYNQPEGTLFADATPQTVDQGALVVGTNTATFQNGHFIYKTNATISTNGKRWGGTTLVGATPQSTIATSTDIAIARSKLSYGYKLNDMAFTANGVLIGTDNTGTMPTSTALRIGARDDGAYLNGHIASLRYFKKRLTNAKLVTLTTP